MPQYPEQFPKFRAQQLNRTIAGLRAEDLATMVRSNPQLFNEWFGEIEAQLQQASPGSNEQTVNLLVGKLKAARELAAADLAA